jgi:predicted transcriptional regulator
MRARWVLITLGILLAAAPTTAALETEHNVQAPLIDAYGGAAAGTSGGGELRSDGQDAHAEAWAAYGGTGPETLDGTPFAPYASPFFFLWPSLEANAAAAVAADTQEGAHATVSASAAGVEVEERVSSDDVHSLADGAWEAPSLGRDADEPETVPSVTTKDDDAKPFESRGLNVAAPDADPAAFAAIAATTLVTGAAVGLLLMPGWRAVLLRILKGAPLLFLFSRISRSDALEHQRRSELFDFVKQNPGERVEVARKSLGLANGTMLHHLRVLEDKDLVRAVRDGGMTRLYPAGPRIRPQPYLIPQRQQILETLSRRPGLVQRELASRLSMSERMVSYHVSRLVEQELLRIEREGTRKRCYARMPDAPQALQAATVTA